MGGLRRRRNLRCREQRRAGPASDDGQVVVVGHAVTHLRVSTGVGTLKE